MAYQTPNLTPRDNDTSRTDTNVSQQNRSSKCGSPTYQEKIAEEDETTDGHRRR